MPRTRGNATTGADAEAPTPAQNEVNAGPDPSPLNEGIKTTSTKQKSRKRKSSSSRDEKPKKRKSTQRSKLSGANSERHYSNESSDASPENRKPRLTTPDLEFDYDRAQLRDPRPTPGRKARPRYDELDIPPDLKEYLLSNREVPKPEKPKGRLNQAQKDQLFKEEAIMNPLCTFHDLDRCHQKGREGSPTYDSAGFQLDFNKVENWMKPTPYNKQKMIRGMDQAIEKSESEEKQIHTLFFREVPKDADGTLIRVTDYIKDQVSKDLDIPWHQITPDQVKLWRDRGFEPVIYEEWWKEPTAEETKRFSKMESGCDLRKSL